MRRRAIMIPTMMSGTAPDTTRPTCTITCAQSSPSTATTLEFTITFSESVTGFEVGDFVITNGTKGALGGSGAVYTCDVTPTGMSVVTANVAADVAQDAVGNTNTAATQVSITSTAPFIDAFTRSDGAIGSIWTGETWTISSNATLNTPTLGTEKITNGDMELDANWVNFGTPVTNERSTEQVHGGTYSRKTAVDAQLEGIQNAAFASVKDTWYLFAASVYGDNTNNFRCRISGGSAEYYIWGGGDYKFPLSWLTDVRVYREAFNQNVTPQLLSGGGMTAGTAYLDDVSLKQITANTLFATLPDVGVASVTANIIVAVSPGAAQAGHVLNMDSTSNPQNFVIAYLNRDRADVSAMTAKLDKCVAGVYSSVISGSVTYNAAHNLKVSKNGDNYSLYYGAVGSETQVGTTQAIASMNGTIHGLFSTYSAARLDSYSLNPT